ncbi:PQQ-binding-like beta-propeller repeat protein [Bradyrhizobium tropiciagri]|uniref:outer membrane protein assembly factor BamB family protein n=1 Tax=Bradyrhizobium tropiciagri TaxID=312253 RepID=UPI001BAC0848|nr:PQQ-binding-like beta-propeller repeat protein [Bradyrhizobium tropiciagri]MBR0874241.1 PQQ-binding-like beta-propeller repeat protein [Bradyrhizobium tropiciagri]
MKRIAAAVAVLIWCSLPVAAQHGGAALYAQRCAQCHDGGGTNVRAPSRTALQSRSFDEVLGAITTGTMASFAQGLSNDERAAIASLVTGKAASQAATGSAGQCAQSGSGFPQSIDGPRWNGWAADLNNSRFQPAAMAGLSQDQVPRLRLKWAFGFPDTSNANAQPTVVGGLLFVGGGDYKVRALDAKTGCTRWEFVTEAPVRTAISFVPLDDNKFAVVFGDVRANVYAVDARAGTLIWKSKVDDHPAARITGAPAVYSGVVYVGVSSIEEAIGSRPTYQCCTFRGSVVALKAETGAQIWKAYTIPEAPHPTRANAIGTQLFGPAGASVWSAPTIDVQRRALYVATSNSYADPATDTSDAVLAFDLATGRMLWHQQATPKDSFVVACFGADQSNCPESRGPDHDFGQSPILVSLNDGQRVLVIGQKSGVVHALDPDHEGKILWQTRVGTGGPLGGSEWGSAADRDRIYVAISDVRFMNDGTRRLNAAAGGGLFALDLATGKVSMQVAPVACGDRHQCSPALSAAITLIPGVVFSGGVSGFLRAYATDDSRLLWEIDTARDYTTVNGVAAHGGAMDGPGAVIADGMLYVNSGYAQWGGLGGNVLLAFEVGNP